MKATCLESLFFCRFNMQLFIKKKFILLLKEGLELQVMIISGNSFFYFFCLFVCKDEV